MTDSDPQQGGSYLRDPKTGELRPALPAQSPETDPPKGEDHKE